MSPAAKLKDVYRQASLGDTKCITQVLRDLEGLLQVISRKYYTPGMTHEDIIQILRIGAWKGIINFDLKRLSPGLDVNKIFISWVVKIAEQYLWRDFQLRNPERRGSKRTVEVSDSTSLDSLVQEDGDSGWTRHEIIADGEDPLPLDLVERKDARLRLESLMDKLSPDEQKVIRMHYQEGQSFAEIGRDMAKSREWISKLHKKAIVVLRSWWDYEKKYGLRLTDYKELNEEWQRISGEDESDNKK